jgi:hypothetical protein
MDEMELDAEDRAANEEDARKLENTTKYNTMEDGPQPVEPEPWNDDSGEVVFIDE